MNNQYSSTKQLNTFPELKHFRSQSQINTKLSGKLTKFKEDLKIEYSLMSPISRRRREI